MFNLSFNCLQFLNLCIEFFFKLLFNFLKEISNLPNWTLDLLVYLLDSLLPLVYDTLSNIINILSLMIIELLFLVSDNKFSILEFLKHILHQDLSKFLSGQKFCLRKILIFFDWANTVWTLKVHSPKLNLCKLCFFV